MCAGLGKGVTWDFFNILRKRGQTELPWQRAHREEQLITDEYYNTRGTSPEGSDYESGDSGSEDESPSDQAARPSLELRDLDVEEERLVKEFCELTCKCQKSKGGPCSA